MKNEIETTPRAHHAFSPSSLQNREACPCFENSHSDNEASFFGTLQHTAVDQGLDDPRLSDARALAVADCVAFAESRAALYPGGTVIREAYLPVDDETYLLEINPVGTVEQRYQIIESTTAGYLDIAIISADETDAEIWDWKFGQHIVAHAKTNLQGIAYMLGLKKKYPKLERIKVGFIQPHADDQSEHTFKINEDWQDLYLRVKTVVNRAMDVRRSKMDFSKANANVSCLFCANIGRCPAVGALALKVGKKHAPVEVPDDITPSLLLDPEQVSKGIKLAQIVKTWAEAYRAQATAKTIEDPNFIPDGYKLVQCEGKTKVRDESLVEQIAKGFIPESYWHLVEALRGIPIGKLDDLITSLTPRGSKEIRVQEFRDSMAEAGATERGNPYAILRMSQVKETKE